MTHNDFSHIELATDDPKKAQKFYGGLFGWSFEDIPPLGTCLPYTMIQPGAGPTGGILSKPQPEIPTAWMPYVQVEQMESDLEKTKALGGEVLMPVTEFPGGRFAVIKDPTGGVIGLLDIKS